MQQFADFGPWTAFALETINDSIEMINTLGGRGVEVVSDTRQGEYRYWDPETLKVDREAENLFVERLKKYGINATVLSEEAGTLELSSETPNVGLEEKVYFISDPFDGSLLYKRQIPAFWFTTLAIYALDKSVKCAVVGDCAARSVDFCNQDKAYTARLAEGGLEEVKELQPRDTEKLEDAFLETYLMKPHYMYPAVKDFEGLFSQVKFILPNGGPGGFSDVASGRVDVYFANKQPFVDVFTGLAIAQKAGCIISTFEGEKVPFNVDINSRYNVVCSANEKLHQQVLDTLSK
jgi:fructose-1,6-bisphosphatase/inositol monophosphatase family enzyme